MLARLSALFASSRTSPPPSSIRAGQIRKLEELGPMLNHQRADDEVQVRVSWGRWKLKLGPSSASRSAREHQRAAVTQSAALWHAAMAGRKCQDMSKTLLAVLRKGNTGTLTAGQLRNQLLALKLIDHAVDKKLDPAKAAELVARIFQDTDRPTEQEDLLRLVDFAVETMRTGSSPLARTIDGAYAIAAGRWENARESKAAPSSGHRAAALATLDESEFVTARVDDSPTTSSRTERLPDGWTSSSSVTMHYRPIATAGGSLRAHPALSTAFLQDPRGKRGGLFFHMDDWKLEGLSKHLHGLTGTFIQKNVQAVLGGLLADDITRDNLAERIQQLSHEHPLTHPASAADEHPSPASASSADHVAD